MGLLNGIASEFATDDEVNDSVPVFCGPREIDEKEQIPHPDKPGKFKLVATGRKIIGVPSTFSKSDVNDTLAHIANLLNAGEYDELATFVNEQLAYTVASRLGRKSGDAFDQIELQAVVTDYLRSNPTQRKFGMVARMATCLYNVNSAVGRKHPIREQQFIDAVRANRITVGAIRVPEKGTRKTKNATNASDVLLVASGPATGSYGYEKGDVEKAPKTKSGRTPTKV